MSARCLRVLLKEFEFERQTNWIEWDSLESFADFFMARFPPLVTARAMLGDRFGELREQIVKIWKNANEATDGSLRLPQEYLLLDHSVMTHSQQKGSVSGAPHTSPCPTFASSAGCCASRGVRSRLVGTTGR